MDFARWAIASGESGRRSAPGSATAFAKEMKSGANSSRERRAVSPSRRAALARNRWAPPYTVWTGWRAPGGARGRVWNVFLGWGGRGAVVLLAFVGSGRFFSDGADDV